MNIVACCLAVGAALLTIFQPLSMPILPFLKGSFFDLLVISLKTVTNPTMRYLYNAGNGDWSFAWIVLAIVFGLAALGLWGGRRAFKKQGGVVPLAINAVVFLGIFGLFNIMARSRGIRILLIWEMGLWGALYAAAAVYAREAKKEAEEASLAPSGSSKSPLSSVQNNVMTPAPEKGL